MSIIHKTNTKLQILSTTELKWCETQKRIIKNKKNKIKNNNKGKQCDMPRH
jgi:hypothetical protein